MNKKENSNLFKIIIMFVSALLIGGWFYWFQLRPTQIRKECTQSVSDSVTYAAKLGMFTTQSEIDNFNTKEYVFCLHKNGLN